MSTIQQDIPVIVGLTINMNIVVFLISIIKLLIFAISSPYIIVKWFFCLHLFQSTLPCLYKVLRETILQNCTLIIVKTKTTIKRRTNFDKKKHYFSSFYILYKRVVFVRHIYKSKNNLLLGRRINL